MQVSNRHTLAYKIGQYSCLTLLASVLAACGGGGGEGSSSSSSSGSGSSSSSSSSTSGGAGGSGLHSYADFPVGVAVNLADSNRNPLTNQARADIVLEEFDQLSVENSMKMNYWNENNFSNQPVEDLANWARSYGLTIHGHTLVWHRSYQLPNWATDGNSNFRNAYVNHIQGVASQHEDVIVSWDVVNEALYDSADDGDNGPNGTGAANVDGIDFRRSVFFRELGADYIADAFRAADQVTDADLYYNDFNIENGQDKTTSLVNLLQRLVDDNVPIDGVGFQMHVLPDWPSLDTIKESWRRALAVSPNLKLKITELDIRINNEYSDPPQIINSCNNCPELQNQKQRYKDIVNAYYEVVPAHRRGGITIWGISDSDSWFAQDTPEWPLLWDNNLQPKPAYDGVLEALQAN